ncbi:unnamed protein product, partial [Coregonus sp. 'balchen']
EPSGDQRSGARYLHNVNGVSNLQGESEKCIVNGGGEGENTDSLQQKKATSPGNSWIQEGVDASQNGAVVTPAAGATAGHSGNVCRLAGAQDLTENGSSGVNGSRVECTTETPEDPSPSRSTVKPLHTNSLTGDAGQEFLIKNTFLYYLLTFGTELCNEPFYVTFFPFFIWNVDAYGSRRLIVVWVWDMYLGQSTKDVIRWSRPVSPPVVKVEMFYNSEYNMPSTPFSLFLLTYGRWERQELTVLMGCSPQPIMFLHNMSPHHFLSTNVFLYCGITKKKKKESVNGKKKVFQPALDLIDNFNLKYCYAPLIIISLHLGMGLFSFTLDTWSTPRGNTTQILGTGAGVALASHLNHYLGQMPDPPLDQLPLSTLALRTALLAVAMLRFCLGMLVLLANRALMKVIIIHLACRISGILSGDVRKAWQHMEVELPYRYIMYGTVGFNALFVVPQLLTFLQLA